jgi:hypothetical protein
VGLPRSRRYPMDKPRNGPRMPKRDPLNLDQLHSAPWTIARTAPGRARRKLIWTLSRSRCLWSSSQKRARGVAASPPQSCQTRVTVTRFFGPRIDP